MTKYKGVVIHPDEISQRWKQLILDAGLNLLGIHPEGGLTAGQSVDDAIHVLEQSEVQLILEELKSHGVAIEHELHALSWLLPRQLFAKHPQWFRMNENRQRVSDYDLCISNKEALDYIAERAALLARLLKPTNGLYHFWLDDVEETECCCNDCKRLQYTPSDFAMTIYNAISRGIRTAYPDAKQCYLAYHGTITAPRKVEPEEGIFLEFAPMDRDVNVPINDAGSEKNKLQIAALDDLFRVFGAGNSKVLDYWLDNSWFSKWKQPPQKLVMNDTSVIAADARYYNDRGFETITTFACFLGDDYYQMYHESPDINAYATALENSCN